MGKQMTFTPELTIEQHGKAIQHYLDVAKRAKKETVRAGYVARAAHHLEAIANEVNLAAKGHGI